MKKTLLFIFLIFLVYNTIGQITPRYLDYKAPEISSGTTYQHPRPSIPSTNNYTYQYKSKKKEPENTLGTSYFTIYQSDKGFVYLGKDSEGHHVGRTKNLSNYDEYTMYMYYTFKDNYVIKEQLVVVCDKSEPYARVFYDHFYTSFLEKYDQEYFYKDKIEEAVVLIYSYFATAFVYSTEGSYAKFVMEFRYK